MQKDSILTVWEQGSASQPTDSASHLYCKTKIIEKNLTKTYLKSQYVGFLGRNQFLTNCWISPDGFRLSDIACRFICAYWRVSAGPCVKSSGNSPEAIHPLLWWKPSLKEHFLLNALQGYCWWWHISGVNIRKAPAVERLIRLIRICIGVPGRMLRPNAVRRVRFGCHCWRDKNAFDMNSLKRQLCHMDHMIISLLNEGV